MLDNIESNLGEANDYMEKAETNLNNAEQIHKKNRSKMCWIMLCLVVLGIILVLYLLGVFKIWFN
jgi:t-SNARE complex subunit (syntaxin)